MDKYIQEIIDRLYTNEFVKEKLNIIVPKIISYFGSQYLNSIIDALRCIEINVCPTTQDLDKFINNKLNIKIDTYYNNYLNTSLINKSHGLSYTISPEIKYNKESDEFINKGRTRKIIFIREKRRYENAGVITFQENDEYVYRTIIHELIVQIKSIKNNNVIRNNKRITRNGVFQSFSSIIRNNDNIELMFVSEAGDGFNSAMTEFDTINVYKSIFNEEPTACVCPLEVNIIKNILRNEGLIDLIHKYEINGNVSELRNLFDNRFYDGSFDTLLALLDKIKKIPYTTDKIIYDILREEAKKFIETLSDEKNPKLSLVG